MKLNFMAINIISLTSKLELSITKTLVQSMGYILNTTTTGLYRHQIYYLSECEEGTSISFAAQLFIVALTDRQAIVVSF